MAAVLVWAAAQFVKPFVAVVTQRTWQWHLMLSSGGMPSSHSALVSGLAWALGLQEGFASPAFAISTVLAMIVIYDSTGVRRAAGEQARILNLIVVDDLLKGKFPKQARLREMLGHTPKQAISGTLFGIVGAWLAYLVLQNYG